jgi:hypothetical protein
MLLREHAAFRLAGTTRRTVRLARHFISALLIPAIVQRAEAQEVRAVVHHVIGMRFPDSLDASRAVQRMMQRQSPGAEHTVGGPAAIFPGDDRFRNAGRQDHDYALVQLPDSADPIETARRLGQADLTQTKVKLMGGAAVLSPGRSSWTRVTLVPGHYAVMCFVSDEKDRREHYLHGMVRTFDVH